MKTGFEFSDPYKFLVSAGIVLITLSVIFPLFLLQTSFDALISTDDIAKLTPVAQNFIQQRQLTAYWLISNVHWLSLLIASFGATCIVAGLFLWYSKHQREEEIKILEENKKILEAKAWTPDRYREIVNKAKRELDLLSENKESSNPINPVLTIAKYRDIQSKITLKLRESYKQTHYLRNEWQTGQSEYLVLHTKHSQNPHAVIKIKYTDQVRKIDWYQEAIDSALLSAQFYDEEHKHKVFAIVIFVTTRDLSFPIKEVNTYAETSIGNLKDRIRICFYKETDLANLIKGKDFDFDIFPNKPEALSNRLRNNFLGKLNKNFRFISLFTTLLIIVIPIWAVFRFFGIKGILWLILTTLFLLFLLVLFYLWTRPSITIAIQGGLYNNYESITFRKKFLSHRITYSSPQLRKLDLSAINISQMIDDEGKFGIYVEALDLEHGLFGDLELHRGETQKLFGELSISYVR